MTELTREQIMAMGEEELNKAIAELKGMAFRQPGHGPCCTCQVCGHHHDDCQCEYSTDISAAWELVEEMRDEWELEFYWEDKCWWLDLRKPDDKVMAHAATAPIAICRAYLLAKQGDSNEQGT